MEKFDKQEQFDKEIKPQAEELAKKCKELGIASYFDFISYDDDERTGVSVMLQPGELGERDCTNRYIVMAELAHGVPDPLLMVIFELVRKWRERVAKKTNEQDADLSDTEKMSNEMFDKIIEAIHSNKN